MHFNHRIPHSSRWLVGRQLLTQPPESQLSAWLLDSSSLTQRLIEVCDGQFSVRVLRQGWARPSLEESRRLGIRMRQLSLIREVLLNCDQQGWVFARTVIPHKTLSGAQRQLARLGDRPLGAFLFSEPSMRREPLEIACLKPGEELFEHAVMQLGDNEKPNQLWGRRSVFRLKDKPLLVNEIFLPAIPSR